MAGLNSGWSEEQSSLLKYSLRNILMTFKRRRYNSNKFYLATPFNKGYRFFDFESDSLEDMVFKGTELLKLNNFDSLNLETSEGIPILSIYLEAGPTIIIKDIVTDEIICNILL